MSKHLAAEGLGPVGADRVHSVPESPPVSILFKAPRFLAAPQPPRALPQHEFVLIITQTQRAKIKQCPLRVYVSDMHGLVVCVKQAVNLVCCAYITNSQQYQNNKRWQVGYRGASVTVCDLTVCPTPSMTSRQTTMSYNVIAPRF